jgi:hypothetical protein
MEMTYGKEHFCRRVSALPDAAYRPMSQDQEPAAFAILEAEFAKGRGRHTAKIVLHGKVNSAIKSAFAP